MKVNGNEDRGLAGDRDCFPGHGDGTGSTLIIFMHENIDGNWAERA